jgi:uncharacterized protein YndB with AHSA1/START domain
VSSAVEDAQLDAPVGKVWDLVGDPARYPEWFPRVFEIQGERYEEGGHFVMVTRHPIIGRDEPQMLIDRKDDLHEIRMHCTVSGMFVDWQLTDAQGGTFVHAEFGMDPLRRRDKIMDAAAGRRFFRKWLDEAVDGLRAAAERSNRPSGARSR